MYGKPLYFYLCTMIYIYIYHSLRGAWWGSTLGSWNWEQTMDHTEQLVGASSPAWEIFCREIKNLTTDKDIWPLLFQSHRTKILVIIWGGTCNYISQRIYIVEQILFLALFTFSCTSALCLQMLIIGIGELQNFKTRNQYVRWFCSWSCPRWSQVCARATQNIS